MAGSQVVVAGFHGVYQVVLDLLPEGAEPQHGQRHRLKSRLKQVKGYALDHGEFQLLDLLLQRRLQVALIHRVLHEERLQHERHEDAEQHRLQKKTESRPEVSGDVSGEVISDVSSDVRANRKPQFLT